MQGARAQGRKGASPRKSSLHHNPPRRAWICIGYWNAQSSQKNLKTTVYAKLVGVGGGVRREGGEQSVLWGIRK